MMVFTALNWNWKYPDLLALCTHIILFFYDSHNMGSIRMSYFCLKSPLSPINSLSHITYNSYIPIYPMNWPVFLMVEIFVQSRNFRRTGLSGRLLYESTIYHHLNMQCFKNECTLECSVESIWWYFQLILKLT